MKKVKLLDERFYLLLPGEISEYQPPALRELSCVGSVSLIWHAPHVTHFTQFVANFGSTIFIFSRKATNCHKQYCPGLLEEEVLLFGIIFRINAEAAEREGKQK